MNEADFFEKGKTAKIPEGVPLMRPEGSQPSITPGVNRGKDASSFHKPRRGVIVRALPVAPCDTPSGLYGRRMAIPRLAPGVIDGFAPFGASRLSKLVRIEHYPTLNNEKLSTLKSVSLNTVLIPISRG